MQETRADAVTIRKTTRSPVIETERPRTAGYYIIASETIIALLMSTPSQ